MTAEPLSADERRELIADPRLVHLYDAYRIVALLIAPSGDLASERGRLLAERDRLIAAGVDPANLAQLEP